MGASGWCEKQCTVSSVQPSQQGLSAPCDAWVHWERSWGWDLGVREAAVPAAASVNLVICECGKSGIWKSGNLEIWNPPQIQKMTIIRLSICHAQNVGKALISRKTTPNPFGTIFDDFPWAEQTQESMFFCLFPLVGQ